MRSQYGIRIALCLLVVGMLSGTTLAFIANKLYNDASPVRPLSPVITLGSGVVGTTTIYQNQTSGLASVVGTSNSRETDRAQSYTIVGSNGQTSSPLSNIFYNDSLYFVMSTKSNPKIVQFRFDYHTSFQRASVTTLVVREKGYVSSGSPAHAYLQVYNYTSASWQVSIPTINDTVLTMRTAVYSTNPSSLISSSGWMNLTIYADVPSGTFSISSDFLTIRVDKSTAGVFLYDYIMTIRNTDAVNSYRLRLRYTTGTGLSRLVNVTVTFRAASTSNQIVVINGTVTNSLGPLFTISPSQTIYLMVYEQINGSGYSSLATYLEVLPISNVSPFDRLTVTVAVT